MDLAKNSIEEIIAQRVEALVLQKLAPVVTKIREAAKELKMALGDETPEHVTEKRSLRTRAQSKHSDAGEDRPTRKRAPKGALQAAITQILHSSSGPLTLTAIRDKVLETKTFRSGNRNGIYSQTAGAIGRIKGIKKTAEGYSLSPRQ